jgi:hypothetical protein
MHRPRSAAAQKQMTKRRIEPGTRLIGGKLGLNRRVRRRNPVEEANLLRLAHLQAAMLSCVR